MAERSFQRWLFGVGAAVLGVVLAGALIWRDDILRASLDPQTPFQVYHPPPAPDYARKDAWALMPAKPLEIASREPAADVFFVSPTTFNGGRDWNAPINDAKSDRLFRHVMAPNYAGPFVRAGRIFAPRYRHASLYTLTTLREDAREARKFPYADVAAAFGYYLKTYNHGRPIIVVGVEQGGTMVARLLTEVVMPDAELRSRLVSAYMIDAVTPADRPPLTPCERRSQAHCLAAWVSVYDTDMRGAKDIQDRALVWGPGGELENLHGRQALCFNPLLGATTNAEAPARLGLGSANATGLEWGVRPPLLTRQVSAQCRNGLLRVSHPRSTDLKPLEDWADRQKAVAYSLFYADLEADSKARLGAWQAGALSPHP